MADSKCDTCEQMFPVEKMVAYEKLEGDKWVDGGVLCRTCLEQEIEELEE